MTYVDGMLAPVPTDKKDDFLRHARTGAEVFRKYGALAVVDCWGDDVPEGEVTSMRMAVKLNEGETVALSWIVWPDKATRDAGWEKAMADPAMSPEANPFPFDGARLIYGAFDVLNEA